MSKELNGSHEPKQNEVWKNNSGDTSTRGEAVVYDKRYEWGGGG